MSCDNCQQLADRLAAVQAQVLDIVKHACDIECQSPGSHRQCSSHEPYRVLRAALDADRSTDPSAGSERA